MTYNPQNGKTLAEIAADCEPLDLAKDHDFGVWHYCADEYILTFGLNHHDYEIDLEGIGTSDGMLDWIFHIAEKSWATSAVVHDLVLAFCEIFGRGICGSGIDKPLPSGFSAQTNKPKRN